MRDESRSPQGTSPATGRSRRVPECAEHTSGCEISELFRVLGKTYMLWILHILLTDSGKARRFVELQHELEISPNTLSERLKELVKAGLLSRTVFNEIPPRVDYQVTAKAMDLESVFEALGLWADRHNLRPEPTGARPKATAET